MWTVPLCTQVLLNRCIAAVAFFAHSAFLLFVFIDAEAVTPRYYTSVLIAICWSLSFIVSAISVPFFLSTAHLLTFHSIPYYTAHLDESLSNFSTIASFQIWILTSSASSVTSQRLFDLLDTSFRTASCRSWSTYVSIYMLRSVRPSAGPSGTAFSTYAVALDSSPRDCTTTGYRIASTIWSVLLRSSFFITLGSFFRPTVS